MSESIDERLITIANALLSRTRNRTIKWRSVSTPNAEGIYVCSFSGSSVAVTKYSFGGPKGRFDITILNDQAVEVASGSTGKDFPREILEDLYSEIEGSLKKVDETLNALLTELENFPRQ